MADMYGHLTGSRSIALSSDDELPCAVSKNVKDIEHIQSILYSLPFAFAVIDEQKKRDYWLIRSVRSFLPGNTHFLLGTREGYLLVVDVP
jgi:hypothetical protein